MKKVYNLLSLMLLFLFGVSSASAQERDWTVWEASDEQISAPADGMQVVFQQGNNCKGWSKDAYLSSTGVFQQTIDATCIYELKNIGQIDDGSDLFVLKNLSNKQYLDANGSYTLSISDAFQCTIKKADASGDDIRAQITGEEIQPEADGVNWVVAYKDLKETDEGTIAYYMGYWGVPSISKYYDTNDWKIFEAKSHDASADNKLETVYNEIFSNGFDEVEYPVGVQPGCVSQELRDRIEALYNAANDAMGNSAVSDETKEELVKNLLQTQRDLETGRVTLQTGKYYMFVNKRSEDAMYDAGTQLRCTKGKMAIDKKASDAKYIWLVTETKKGQYQLQNFGTGHYAGKYNSSRLFTSTEEPQTTFSFHFNASGAVHDNVFYIAEESGNLLHNAADMNICIWNDKNEQGNLYSIIEIPTEFVDSLTSIVEKNRFMEKFNTLLTEAKATSTKYLYDSDVTFDDKYASTGLTSTFEAENAKEPTEGPASNAFDGNLTTFYHTLWTGKTPGQYHWVQVNLGEEPIQKLFLKMTQRHNNRNGNPSRIALVAPAETDDFEGAWTDTLFKDTIIYQYDTNFPTGLIKNTTAVVHIDLGKPVTHLRFVGLQTRAGGWTTQGPCWHLAELHFYKDGGDNPRYTMIPENIRQALADAIAHGQAVASDSTATQADYDAIKAAMKAFEDAYPDDSELNDLLESAKSQAEAEGMVGTDWGYFPAGAQETLAETVNEVSEFVKANAPLSLTQIADQLAKLRAAITAFNSKLIVPEDGTFVRIKSASVNEDGAELAQYGNYVYAADADTVANIQWGYAEDENQSTRLDAVWQIQKQSDGSFAFRNVATGRYMGNVYDGVEDADEVSMSTRLKSVDHVSTVVLTSGKRPGVFNLQLREGVYVNTDPSGRVTCWNDGSACSLFEINEVSSDIVSEGMTVDVKEGVYQVMTLPFDVAYVAPSPYKVLGQKEGKLQLALYGDDEIIPAGTPFIVKPEDETNYVQVGLVAADASELVNGTYVYDHITQNGLVGMLQTLTLEANLGLLLDNVIKNSLKGTTVNAGSGYFVEIPETAEDGDVQLNIEDVINGINNAVVSSTKASAVYTLSGVKVRSNAKSLENLPKGIYIVNGKKVYVK